jgi:D-amino-acid dehydrogenase
VAIARPRLGALDTRFGEYDKFASTTIATRLPFPADLAKRRRFPENPRVPANSKDVIVLGAGFVGVSAALHLQARGRSVAIVDRLGEVAGETSFGNTGIVQAEAVFPYMFPRAPAELFNAALNRDPRAQIRYSALPSIAPFLWRYFLASTPSARLRTAHAMRGLVELALAEHQAFATPANTGPLLRSGGWIKAFRTPRGRDAGIVDAEETRPFGVAFDILDRDQLLALEPHLSEHAVGGVHFKDPMTTSNPEALAKSYAELFFSRGGVLLKGDGLRLQASGDGWTVPTSDGPLSAREVVIAMGPWSNKLAGALGYKLPFGVKRGYHMHYAPRGNAGLSRPVLDFEKGYVVTPMARGLRLTTGAEFARAEDPPSNAHLDRLEPFAREMYPIAERRDATPWLGRRPCLPDMTPIIGPAPRHKGLWFDFGHQHLGLTLGPVSGRLLGQMMTGETTFIDPAPFRMERFG